MVLERDEFVVTYDATKATEDQIVTIAGEAGFATRLVSDAVESQVDVLPQSDTEFPAFFVASQDQARRENKFLVVDFSASWCLPCQRMIRETFPDPRVAPLLEQCVFLEVDTDEHPSLAQRFGVTGLPDIRILSSDAEEVRRLRDYQSPEAFAAVLTELLSGWCR